MKPKTREISPVRMRAEDKEYIAKLAKETKRSQADLLHHAVELLKREKQFAEMREAYSNLGTRERAAMQAESEAFDRASGDGLE